MGDERSKTSIARDRTLQWCLGQSFSLELIMCLGVLISTKLLSSCVIHPFVVIEESWSLKFGLTNNQHRWKISVLPWYILWILLTCATIHSYLRIFFFFGHSYLRIALLVIGYVSSVFIWGSSICCIILALMVGISKSGDSY